MIEILLWLCIWGTYNTDIFRIFNPGFPHSVFDLIHGVRSFLPFVAIIFSCAFLFKKREIFKKFSWSAVGFLVIYSLLEIISSVFSNRPIMSIYWGILYAGVLFCLLAFINNKNILRKIIIVNFIVAGIITVVLTILFFSHSEAVKSLTYNFLICSQRPYEGIGSLQAGGNVLDMASTRPTGLGRYAGITTIACLAAFYFSQRKTYTKKAWFFAFVIFLAILLFSKGKTEMVAFIASLIFLLWAAKKVNIFSVVGTIIIIAISGAVIFYNIPCTNENVFFNNNAKILPTAQVVVDKPIETKVKHQKVPETIKFTPVVAQTPKVTVRTSVITLSGRTSGVWTDSWYLFLKNPLFGYGAQADRYFLNGQHAHNTIIHALLQAGLLGTAAFVLAFVLILVYLVRLFRNKEILQTEKPFLIAITAVLIFFVVRGLTESLAFFSADWLFVAPIIAYIQAFDAEVKRKNNSKIMEFTGMKVNLSTMSEVLDKIKYWIKNESQKSHQIIVTGMHGISQAGKNKEFKQVINSADMFVPDGISLVWLAKLKGFGIKERISGADLMKDFFKMAEKENFTNYFYGDTPENLNLLNQKLKENFSNLKIAGMFSPPFKELSEKEEQEIIEKINNARPDVLWVALGLPKQEKWIYENKNKLNVPVIIGVGAAFKFLSGSVKRAPKWVGNLGFEWLWRLIFEFKTTWKRVVFGLPFFVKMVIIDLLK